MKQPGPPTSSGRLALPPTRPVVDLDAVLAARERLRNFVHVTPCDRAPELGAEARVGELFLKRDYLQPTGSFKERGACHALLCLGAEARWHGVVAASAGNHALGLARHGARLGIPVTLVMPRGAARAKVDRCRQLGATVLLEGERFDEAGAFAREVAAGRGAAFVHPFDDPTVIAGQGTLALEILEQVHDVDALLVPVGGGGLLAGVVAVVKALRPEVSVFAVEPAAAASLSAAAQAGKPMDVVVHPSLADGLSVSRVGSQALSCSLGRIDGVVNVSEDEIAWSMLRLFEVERSPVEGAGATALAALLAQKFPDLAGKRVVVPVSGANVDASIFARALHLGLNQRARERQARAS